MTDLSEQPVQRITDPHEPEPNGFQDASEIFNRAVQSFRASLSDSERHTFRQFENPQLMVAEIEEHCRKYYKNRNLLGFCRRIQRFAKAWEPFFEITNIFISSNPEWAGIAWGAIRLVFLLSSHYTTFIDKLTLMFEGITQRLPSYQEHYERLMKRERFQTPSSPGGVRLVQALSYVYEDIICFCQQACKIFATKKGGVKYKATVVHDLFWKPFDARFSSLLSRMADHRDLFETEIRLEDQKVQQRHMEETERQGKLTDEGFGRLENAINTIKNQIDRAELQNIQRTEALKKSILQREIKLVEDRDQIEDANKKTLAAKVSELKHWISAPDYRKIFERARRTRLHQTAEWLLESRAYIEWQNSDCLRVNGSDRSSDSSIEPQYLSKILLIQANPGYGKTTLSSVIIEDVQSELYTLVGGATFPRNVVFFHFGLESPETNDPSQALRSVLFQALHINRYDQDFVDALSLLMDCTGTGQAIASDEDLEQAFLFFAERLPGMFIIIDGLDECTEPIRLFIYLCEVRKACSIKIVLLSRPNINIPRQYENEVTRMELTAKDNIADIERYLKPEVENIQQSKAIIGDLSQNAVVARIASRANGMFLWAYLMVKYLESPGLSISDKREALLETNLIEGLDAMYRRILSGLEKGFARERAKVHRIFQLLITAIRPLTIAELQAAVAIEPGSVTARDNYISNFEKGLVVMSGAFVEVGFDKAVRFIHSSAGEFLEGNSFVNERPGSHFFVDRVIANILFANICLTTIIFDIPTESRNLNADAWPNKSIFNSSPFLKYAVLHWPTHIYEGIVKSTEKDAASWSQLLLNLSSFLRNPMVVTTWIEAMWILKTKPDLTKLVRMIKSVYWRRLFPSTLGSSEGLIVIRLLSKFAEDVHTLNKNWSRLLAADPSAIWGPHITAFSKSKFWVETSESKVTLLGSSEPIGNKEGKDWITIASQTSLDGKIVSIISVKPSAEYVKAVELASNASKKPDLHAFPSQFKLDPIALDKLCQGWKARYTGYSLKDKSVLFEAIIALPADQIATIIRLDSEFMITKNFSFPVAFSPDVCQIIILRLFIRINRDLMSNSSSLQSPQEIYNSQLLQKAHGDTNLLEKYKTTNFVFSPNLNFIAIVEGKGPPEGYVAWRVEVWRDSDPNGLVPQFEFLGTVQPSHLYMLSSKKFTHLAFHPTLPLLVFPRWGTTSLWWFGIDGKSPPEDIISISLERLSFLNETDLRGYPILNMLDVEEAPWEVAPELKSPEVETSGENEVYHSMQHMLGNPELDRELNYPRDPVEGQEAGHIIVEIKKFISRYLPEYFSRSRDSQGLTTPSVLSPSTLEKSQIIQIPHGRDVQLLAKEKNVYEIAVENEVGVQKYGSSQFSIHLPQLAMAQNTLLSFIRPQADDEWLTIVWNKASQLTYNVLAPPDQYVPSIIQRKRNLSATGDKIGFSRACKRIRQVADKGSSAELEEPSTE